MNALPLFDAALSVVHQTMLQKRPWKLLGRTSTQHQSTWRKDGSVGSQAPDFQVMLSAYNRREYIPDF